MAARQTVSAVRVLATLLLAIPLLFSGGVVFVPAAPARADELADQIAAARQRQADLLRSIDRQRDLVDQLRADEDLADLALQGSATRLDGINVDQAAVRDDIQAATDALRRVEARRDSLVAELRQLDWTLALLQSEIAQGEQDLEARKRQLGERLADAYRTGQTSLLEQILGSGSFTDILTGVDAQLRFGDQDVELARAIEADQVDLDSLRRVTAATRYNTDQLRIETLAAEAELRTRQQKLEAAQDRLAAIEAETRRLQEAQRAEFQRITGDQEDAAAQVRADAAAEDQLAAQIASLVAEAERRAEEERLRRQRERERQQRLQEQQEQQEQQERQDRPDPTPTPDGTGLLDWPVSGYVTQEYGCTTFDMYPPGGGCAHWHDGIDIANADGTLIRAAASGVVAFAGWNPYDSSSDPAFIVVIGHAYGLDTWYVHLQPKYAPGIRAGSRVSRGQVVGYMGNTGNSTGTHLHWEVHKNGNDVNPRSQV